MRRSLSLLILCGFMLVCADSLVVGGYATYQEMLVNAPSLLDSSMHLEKEKRVECQRSSVYTLRYRSSYGNERSWVSEKKLWGYSDGNQVYIFEKGFFSPLQAYDSSNAWFYALATRSSSGPQGVLYLERPFLYDAAQNRSSEVSYKMIKELFAPYPELIKQYDETVRKERDIPTFLNAYFAWKASSPVEPTPPPVELAPQEIVPPSGEEVPVVQDSDSLPVL